MVSNRGHWGLAGGEPASPRRKVDIVYPLVALPLESLFLVTHLGGSLLNWLSVCCRALSVLLVSGDSGMV